MRRPALTRKAIENLRTLMVAASGTVDDYAICDPELHRECRDAESWIERCRIWKQEQHERKTK